MAITPFHTIPIEECGEPLVKLGDSEFITEPVYYNEGLSQVADMYVRESVYEKLRRIEADLKGKFRLHIWDPWRSREVQQTIFEFYNQKIRAENAGKSEDELRQLVGTFVSPANDMSRIPPHSTGGAIDLTLIDSDGHFLDMGTGFDDTTQKARTNFFSTEQPSPQIHGNRQRLLDVMAKEGFINYPDEWWHFDFSTQLGAYNDGRQGIAIYGEVSSDFRLLQSPDHRMAIPNM